jgi:Na+/proline symporter
MVMSFHGAEQLIVQRVLACKTVRDGRRALILSAAVILPLFLIFLLVGAMLWVYYQKFPLAIAVPHVLKGLLIVAILAAAMSSVSSALTSLASVSTMDFARKLMPDKSDGFFLRFSQVSTVVWGVALIVAASLSRERPFVIETVFPLRGLTSGALLGGLLLAVWWKRGAAAPIIVGMFCSLAVMTWVGRPQAGFAICFPWYTMIGCAVTVGVAMALRKL